MALSDTDSNKYRAILDFKESLPLREESLSPKKSISLATSKINKYGEIEVQCLHQAQKRLTEEEIQELIAEYKNGKSIHALAQRLGIARFLNYYNNERMHQSLNYRTPAELYRLK